MAPPAIGGGPRCPLFSGLLAGAVNAGSEAAGALSDLQTTVIRIRP